MADVTGTPGNDVLNDTMGDDNLFGLDGDDTLTASFGNDVLMGGNGSDILNDSWGNDQLMGGVGNDQITSSHGNDVLRGDGGNDSLQDSHGDDQLFGGDGNDILTDSFGSNVLDGGPGTDTITGGVDNDIVLVGAAAHHGLGEVIDGGLGTDVLRFTSTAGGETLVLEAGVTGVEQVVIGTAAGLTTGTTALNVDASLVMNGLSISGNAGANTLAGTGFDDVLIGNGGNDQLNGGAGSDTLSGGAGNDIVLVGVAAEHSAGEVIDGGLGTDALRFTSTTGGETLVLEAGVTGIEQVVIGTAAGLTTGTTNLNVNASAVGTGLTLTGNAGDNVLTGTSGDDILNGGAGNDTLDGGTGADQMAGGRGDDSYIVDAAADVVTESRNAGTDTVSASVNHTLGANVENLTLAGADLNGTGNTLHNVISGTNGINILSGLAGNDFLDGGDGADQLSGGDGNDQLFGGVGQDAITGGLGNDRIEMQMTAGDVDVADGGAGADTLALVGIVDGDGVVEVALSSLTDQVTRIGTVDPEPLTQNNFEHLDASGLGVGSSVDVTGSAAANVLIGSNGNDIINGGAGNDTLNGGTGDDGMDGGVGNDIYVVDSTLDTVTETLVGATGGVDLVQSTAATVTLGANVEHLTLMGTGDIDGTGNTLNNILTGNSGNNDLTGDAGNDTLTGNAGNDTLDGGVGVDRMAGGLGDDIYVVDSASDTVTEAFNAGEDLVQATVSKVLGGNVEHLTLQGSAHLNGTGNALNNTLTGNSGNNILTGLAGADTLTGGDGNDTLDGGFGQDLVNGDAGDDRITMLVTAGNADSINAGADNDTLVLSGVAPGTRAVVVDLSQADQVVLIGGVAEALVQSNFEHLNAAGLSGFVTVTGSTGNNTLIGSSGNDSLDGGAGDDTMSGGRGNDTYTVDSVSDVVTEVAAAGTDTVFSSVDYTLSANVENLELTGTADSDGTGNTLANILIGNSGVNILTGGLGNDTYVVQNDTDSVVETLNAGTDLVQSTAATVTLGANVEHLTLMGTGDIDGTGNTLNNILTGNSGNNDLTGDAGNDTLTGNAGNDTLDGGVGVDRMAGGLGDDIYVVDSASDTVTEAFNAGEDLVQATVSRILGANVEHLTLLGGAHLNGTGNALNNTLTGNSGNNVLVGLAGVDTLHGGDGNDTLDGGLGEDTVNGEAGDDRITMLVTIGNRDAIDAGADNDMLVLSGVAPGTHVVVVDLSQADQVGSIGGVAEALVQSNFEHLNAAGLSGSVTVIGSAGNNTLIGSSGNDSLDGGVGNDQLDGGLGADTMTGGTGDDTYTVDSTSDVVIENPGDANDTVRINRTVNLTLAFTEIEHVVLTGTAAINATGDVGDNSLMGNSGANILLGGDGNDTLAGNAGNDILNGGAGDDGMDGGAGNDTYVVDSTLDTVTEGLAGAAGGVDLVQSGVDYSLGANVENLTLTGSGAVNGTGNALNNILTGNNGDNILLGGDGNDTLDGGAGADTMAGGLGNDTYTIDNVGDIIDEVAGEGNDTVNSNASVDLSLSGPLSEIENITLTGTAALNATGDAGVNTIIGNIAANILIGGGGNDTLIGLAGNDTLNGGTGNDAMDGGAGNDTYVVDSASDVASESVTGGVDLVQSTAASFTLGANIENLTLTGTSNINGTGNALANILTGNSGNNTLTGGAGSDTMVGGAGNDIFRFNVGDGQDVVQDNNGVADLLQFGATLDPLDLVISRQVNDLRIAVHGSSDQVTIKDWYLSTNNRTETIQAGNGEVLLSMQVETLIQAMATFTQTSGRTWDQALDNPGLRPAVQNIIAANWQ